LQIDKIFINRISNSVFEKKKENQKFRDETNFQKKKLITILQGFFHTSNVDKSDRYSAQSMYLNY